MRILAIFLLALPTWACLGSVSFTVPNCSGVARSAEGQTPGVPIPLASNILDVRNLMVTDGSDTIVASHETVTERWGGTPSDVTKAIKWVRIDNLATVASTSGSQFCSGNATQTGGGATYKLKDRTGPDPPLTGVTVTTDSSCSASCKIIDTGAVTYKFRSDLFNGPDSVVVDGGGPTLVSSSLSNGLQIVANGTTYTSASAGTGTPAYSIVVEEPNGVSSENETGATVRAQLHISGAFWNGSNKLGSYDARLIFYAGQSWFKFELAPIYNFDLLNTLNMPTDVAFVMGSSLGNSLTASFGTQYGTSGTSQSVSLTNLQDVYFVQYDHGNNFNASFLCNNDARNCPGLNLQGWSIVKGTTTQFTGHQGDGWINLTDATNSITGWMRDFWQNYPTELEAAGKVLKFHFFPPHGDTPVDGNPNGFLTMITGYKRDQALKGNSGFYLIWPYQTGGAMNMTPVSPNPGRTITAATATNPATITSAGIAHLDNSASDTPCVGPCLYWQPGQKHLVALSGLSGGTWATANTFLLASPTTPTSTVFNLYNLNGTNFDATGLGIPVVTSAKVGALDTQTDVNAAGFAKRYELVISFQTGTGTPATLVPKWRDTLLFTNPTYFTDTAQPWGRMHARDTVNFPQAEKELDALFVNIPRKDLFFNNYGMPYWGVVQYANNGATAAGFAQRYLVTFRKNRMFVPWVQWMRTGDPTFYQMARAWTWFGGEVPVQHIPSYQRDATPGVYFDTWHLQEGLGYDAVGNVLVKHNGSITCTEGWGSALWFNNYNVNTSNPVAPGGATTQRCPDGQQPYLEYPTTGLLADYLIAGDDRDATLVTDVADNELFSASGSSHNSIVCGATEPGCSGDTAQLFVSGGNTGPAAGRAVGGCLQSMGDAHELTWSQGSTHNYFNMGVQCIKAGISATNKYSRWTQNPVGFQGFSFAVPSTRYGQNYFATNWSHWSLPNFADIVGNISIPAPSFATPPANVSINLNDIVTKEGKATGYVNTAAATGLFSFLTPGRVMASAYHNTSDTLLRDMMGREIDFDVMGADDDGTTTGCKNLGNALSTGTVPLTNCPLSTGTPDPHVYSPFVLGVPYWEYELLAHPPSIPTLPPIGWQIPASGATNGPLNFLVHNSTPAATITVSFMLRAENSSSFTGGSPILPSGDITLQVLNSTNSPIPFTLSNASGTVSITGASATVKTPTQEALAFAPPGTTSCLVAPDPPSINYTLDGNNNLDNRYWTVTFSGAAVGDYQYQFTSKVCPGGATFHIATPVATSTGNIDTVICTPPCSVIGDFAKTEVGSAYYFNVPGGVTALRTDSNQTHTLVDPSGNFYRGGTVLTTALNSGFWKVQTFGPWQDYTLNTVTFGGVGGVKPLASPSPATYYDSPAYSNIAFITVPSNPITLNFSGASITTPSPLTTGTNGTPITPVTFACSGCGSISNWSVSSGALPPGLSLGSALNATLSGTPTLPGTYNFTMKATDGVSNPTKPFTMVINGSVSPGLGGTLVLGVTVSSGVVITK